MKRKPKPGTTVVVVDPAEAWHDAHMETGDVGIVVRTRDEDDDWKVDILWLRTGNEDWFWSRHWGEKIRRL